MKATRECRVCLCEHSAAIHEATVRLHEWWKERLDALRPHVPIVDARKRFERPARLRASVEARQEAMAMEEGEVLSGGRE